MKKRILYTVVVAIFCLTFSCTAEELNENEIQRENTEVNANGDLSVTPPKKGG